MPRPANVPQRPVAPRLLPWLNPMRSTGDGSRRPPPILGWRLHGGSGVQEPRWALGRRNPQQIGRGSDHRRLSESFLH
jgi:hypothetical protein